MSAQQHKPQVAFPDTDNAKPDFLFIGELAREAGLDPKTIRFYEREGLLSPPRHGRFRTYLASDVKRLKDVVTMRRRGIAIAQIRSLLDAEGSFTARGSAVETLLSSHLELLKERQADLARQMEATISNLAHCQKAGDGAAPLSPA